MMRSLRTVLSPAGALGSGVVLALVLALGAPASALAQQTDDRVEAALAKGEYAEAEKAIAAGDAKSPKTAFDRARLELVRGRYEDAAKSAQAAMKDKDLKPRAAATRAEALAATGKLDEAIAVLRDVEQEPEARRARLLLGEYLIRSGKRDDARSPLMTLIDDYNTDKIKGTDAELLTYVGRAAHLLRSPRDANDAYNDAEKAGGKKRVETLLFRAELFLEKYDPGNAGNVTVEASKIAPDDPRVRIMMARVKLENAMDFGGAEEEVKQALAINPRISGAFAVRAGIALRDLDIEGADRAADEGLKTNPNDLELLSMKGAIRFLADDLKGFEAVRAKVFALNPTYTSFYQIVGEYAEWEHRYDDIVAFMREAVKIDPRDAKASADLGLNLIRSGNEKEGLEALDKAWEKDPFNVRVFNTRNLYYKSIATDYTTVDGQTFRIRYDKEEKAILERYVPRMLEEAWASMVKRYGFKPGTPVMIELYSNSEHFSVRTSGLPNVGIQGVCFGKTLALLSPRAAPFNWGNVLWHELGHVFAIQMSKNHVPRWYTEGLSEYETIIRRPEWHREEDPALYAALRDGRVPPVLSFNRAFTHVDDVADVTMAYYAASQMVVFMAEKFGFEKTVSMMPKWAAGKRTDAVIQESLGIPAAELDKQFRAWLKTKYGRYDKQFVPDFHAPPLDAAKAAVEKAPTDADKRVDLAIAMMKSGGEKAAIKGALDEALRLAPKHGPARFMLSELAFAKDDLPEAKKQLEAMIADGNDGFVVEMKLASMAEEQKDKKELRRRLMAAAALDPSQSEPVGMLAAMAGESHDALGELEYLRKLVLLEQHDRAAWTRLLELLVERGEWEEAEKVGESAIFVDVGSSEIHRLYARALANRGKFVSAVYEYNSAIIAGARPDKQEQIYRELGKAYAKMGETKMAAQAKEYEAAAKARAEKIRAREKE